MSGWIKFTGGRWSNEYTTECPHKMTVDLSDIDMGERYPIMVGTTYCTSCPHYMDISRHADVLQCRLEGGVNQASEIMDILNV